MVHEKNYSNCENIILIRVWRLTVHFFLHVLYFFSLLLTSWVSPSPPSLYSVVVLHCRLYALRRRYREEALARGGDVLPNGTIRIKKTLDKAVLDLFPVRIFDEEEVSRPSTSSAAMSASAVTLPPVAVTPPTLLADEGFENIELNMRDNDYTIPQPRASKANSIHGSIAGRSIRSERALAAAEELDNRATQEEATQRVSTMIVDTCAVCLEEFANGDEIRTLPCHHEFHCECIGKNSCFLFTMAAQMAPVTR